MNAHEVHKIVRVKAVFFISGELYKGAGIPSTPNYEPSASYL
jgi:hypothetical protein